MDSLTLTEVAKRMLKLYGYTKARQYATMYAYDHEPGSKSRLVWLAVYNHIREVAHNQIKEPKKDG